jgi:hypothetical protein
MNVLKKLLALPLAIAAIVVTDVRAQLTCDQPLPAALGETPFATLLSFPAFGAPITCDGGSFTPVVQHAVYLRFTAPSAGWYVFGARMDACSPELMLTSDCSTAASWPSYHSASLPPRDGEPPCSPPETWKTVSTRLAAGESRVIAVGPSDINCAGNGSLRIVRIGGSLVEGAPSLTVGTNQFTTPAWAPPISIGCNWDARVHNTVVFTFVPPVSGNYRIGTCGTELSAIGTGTDPDFQLQNTRWTFGGGCDGTGSRQIAQFTAGTTYYVCLGNAYWQGGSLAPCQQRQVSVEYVDPCPADFNDDDVTDGVDLGILLAAWGTPARDITGDGTTDGVDLGILLAMWGACPD